MKIASVVVDVIGPDCVFVEEDMMRYKYWLDF